jgi:hypothetical protein
MKWPFPDSLRLPEGRSLVILGSALAAFTLCVLSVPLLSRSPWVDEIMLFLNYPTGILRAFTQPLEWYHQAATPLYSATIGQLGEQRPELVRFVSAFVISFGCLLLLCWHSKSLAMVGCALMALLIFPQPLQMLSEMKHYGFEILGSLLALRWFLDKPWNETIVWRDVLVLALSAMLGISTIPVAGIVLGTHVLWRTLIQRQVHWAEAVPIVVFLAFLLGYYALIKHLMEFLVHNFANTYGEKSVTENLRTLAGSFLTVGGGPSKVLAFAVMPYLVVAYLGRTNPEARRLTVITSVMGLAFVGLTVLEIYPARRARFLTWTVSFIWVYVLAMVAWLPDKGRLTFATKAKYAFVGMLAMGGFLHLSSLWLRLGQDFSSTANNRAVKQLRALPPSKVGFWAGGEPVVEYYRRFYPDLDKHDYFGRSDWRSRYSKWDPLNTDYQGLAGEMLEEAPEDSEFYIFASHYDIAGAGLYNDLKSEGLHSALELHDFGYEPESYRYVTLYKVEAVKSE